MCLFPVYLCKQVVNEPHVKRQGQPRGVHGSWVLVIADRLWELLLCCGSLDLKSKAEEGNRPQLCSTLTASSERNAHSC